MKAIESIRILERWGRQGRHVFRLEDLRKLMAPAERTFNEKSFSEGIRRLVSAGILERVANGVYVSQQGGGPPGSRLLEQIAVAIRRGAWSYVSLESALSEYGAISQIPVSRITVMTTGRAGSFDTPYGVIEFTHTSRTPAEILEGTVDADRPLRLATPLTAWRDLQHVGRNLDMVSVTELAELGLSMDDITLGRQGSRGSSGGRNEEPLTP